MKTINFELSTESIDKAIAELERYRKSLETKRDTLLKRLGLLGRDVVAEIMSGVPEEISRSNNSDYQTDFKVEGGTVIIYLHGDKVAFVEFSAGITYGITGSEYPTDAGAPYGMGTYNPESDNWSNPNGWWFKDPSNPAANKYGWVHTWGNRAYMPMYHAEEAIIIDAVRIAKEVFGGS